MCALYGLAGEKQLAPEQILNASDADRTTVLLRNSRLLHCRGR